MNQIKNMTYKDAGVDVEKGDLFVERIKKMVGKTYNSDVVSGVGGFAALYKMGDGRYLASGTDGVGTKLKLAQTLEKHKTIGKDLVAMCANDIICTGARPLFFLDYLATGKLDMEVSCDIVEGITKACMESELALIGGETAEMPGMYTGGEYDLAGFAVGEVYEKDLLGGEKVKDGDILLGLMSSGFHSNGYGLLRKLFSLEDLSERSFHEALLTPTKLYWSFIKQLKKDWGDCLHGLAHITGGGIENIPRMNSKLHYHVTDWAQKGERPEIMEEVILRFGYRPLELLKSFNMGIGMVMAVDPQKASELLACASLQNLCAFKKIGVVSLPPSGQSMKDELYFLSESFVL